jgi:hypothetical protein
MFGKSFPSRNYNIKSIVNPEDSYYIYIDFNIDYVAFLPNYREDK